MSKQNHVLVITSNPGEQYKIDVMGLYNKHADNNGNGALVTVLSLDSLAAGESDDFLRDGDLLDAVYASETAQGHELYGVVLDAAFRSYSKTHPKVKLDRVI